MVVVWLACCSLREGVLLFSGFQSIAALYWLSYWDANDPWPSNSILRDFNILVLMCNSLLGVAAVRFRSEVYAAILLCCYSLLLGLLTINFAMDHPSTCNVAASKSSDSPLGVLLQHILWTSDACLLMTILGWVTIAVGYFVAFYLWFMYLYFWQLLRAAGEDAKLVTRAIASMPVLRYKGKDTQIPVLDGREPTEATSCAICLGDFEEDEELRLLPCVHVFHKPCIDVWIERSGLNASCPLCKRELLPRSARRTQQSESGANSTEAGTSAGADMEAGAPASPGAPDSSGSSSADIEAGQAQASQPAIQVPEACMECESPVLISSSCPRSPPGSPQLAPLIALPRSTLLSSEESATPTVAANVPSRPESRPRSPSLMTPLLPM